MKPLSTTDETFLRAVLDLVSGGEILVVVRYAYGGGARDFLFLKDVSEFHGLLGRLKCRDSVVVMKSFSKVLEGKIDPELLDAAAEAYPDGACWIVVDKNAPKYEAGNCAAETRADLLDELRDRMGRYVRIIKEPNYISAAHSIAAYIPDEDGVVRPGAY